MYDHIKIYMTIYVCRSWICCQEKCFAYTPMTNFNETELVTHSQANFMAKGLELFHFKKRNKRLTVNWYGGRLAVNRSGDIFGHASIVGSITQPRCHENEVTLARHDEVLVLGGVDPAGVLLPPDGRLRSSFWREASQFNLASTRHLLWVWRCLKKLPQICKNELISP